MNNNRRRDDYSQNRLYSFLVTEGSIHAQTIRKIKQCVFKIKVKSGSHFILKHHNDEDLIKQQWAFFSQLVTYSAAKFIRFPNGKKYLCDPNAGYWTLTPFVAGRSLHYANHEDRLTVLKALNTFHIQARSIYVEHPVKRPVFYMKWVNRLWSFKKTEHIFETYGYATLFKDIIRQSEYHLQQLTAYPWEHLMATAQEQGHWLHGDVAGHNFIKAHETTLIDFDLLTQGFQLYDYIQLGHRFLPYIKWDLDRLLAYNMVSDHVEMWLSALLVPGDLLREWLHQCKEKPPLELSYHLSQMEHSWEMRLNFLNQARNMIKSI